MPRWFSGYQSRIVITDLLSVTTTWLSRLTLGSTLTFNLDQSMTQNVDLRSDDPRVNRVFTDGDPLVAQSNRLAYTFLRTNLGGDNPPWQCIGAAIAMSPEDQADQDVPTSHFSFYDSWQYMYGVPCFLDTAQTPLGPQGLQFFADSFPYSSMIVGTLLRNAVGPGPSVPGTGGNGTFIDAGDGSRSGEGEQYQDYGGTAFYAGTLEQTPAIDFQVQQGTSVGSAWDQLLAAATSTTDPSSDEGLDIVLTPIYDPVNRPGYTHELNVFNLAGVERPGSPMAWGMFNRSAETFDRQHDGTPSAFVNVADFYAGQGGPGVGQVVNAASVAKYLPYWSQQWFPQQPDAMSVLAMAQQVIQLQKQGKRTVVLNPDPLRAIGPFTGYNIGDRLPVYAPSKTRTTTAGLLRVQGIPLVINPDGVARVNGLLMTPDWRGDGT